MIFEASCMQMIYWQIPMAGPDGALRRWAANFPPDILENIIIFDFLQGGSFNCPPPPPHPPKNSKRQIT